MRFEIEAIVEIVCRFYFPVLKVHIKSTVYFNLVSYTLYVEENHNEKGINERKRLALEKKLFVKLILTLKDRLLFMLRSKIMFVVGLLSHW